MHPWVIRVQSPVLPLDVSYAQGHMCILIYNYVGRGSLVYVQGLSDLPREPFIRDWEEQGCLRLKKQRQQEEKNCMLSEEAPYFVKKNVFNLASSDGKFIQSDTITLISNYFYSPYSVLSRTFHTWLHFMSDW